MQSTICTSYKIVAEYTHPFHSSTQISNKPPWVYTCYINSVINLTSYSISVSETRYAEIPQRTHINTSFIDSVTSYKSTTLSDKNSARITLTEDGDAEVPVGGASGVNSRARVVSCMPDFGVLYVHSATSWRHVGVQRFPVTFPRYLCRNSDVFIMRGN